METDLSRPSPSIAKIDSPVSTLVLACVVAVVCYLTDRLAHVFGIPPDQIAAFFPPTPFLVAVLLLTPRKIRPALIVAGMGATVLADLGNNAPIGFALWYLLGNLVEVCVVMLGIDWVFKGVPNLSNVKNLAKYVAVAVILGPSVAAFVGAKGSIPGNYWLQWKLWFFSDALPYLTLTPAILTWAHEGRFDAPI